MNKSKTNSIIFFLIFILVISYFHKSHVSKENYATISIKYQANILPEINNNLGVKVISKNIFSKLIEDASNSIRKRKMTDLTLNPTDNSMQTLINTWINGSFSPVHKHSDYSESFVILYGQMAFFTFDIDGKPKCHILSSDINESESKMVIIVEKNEWHAMTAAPTFLGYDGYAIIFETSGHKYNSNKSSKILAPFSPVVDNGLNGDEDYFNSILKLCPRRKN